MRAKLRSDRREGADAFDYVWDRLEQSQQASVLHLRQTAEDTQSWDPEVLFSYFQRLCHNPREHQEAVQRLSTVRQRDDESLVAYLARFERFLFEADAMSWPDTARISSLHRGLRTSLRQTLEESEDSLFSLSYDSYVEQVQRLEHRTRRHQNQPARNQSQTTRPPEQVFLTKDHQPEDKMDVNVVRTTHANTLRIRPTRSRRSSSSHSSRSPVRYQHRLDNNLCFYCGSADHWIDKCPNSSCLVPKVPNPIGFQLFRNGPPA